MSCIRPVFFPGGPCCGPVGVCPHWPKIDWNSYTWLVTMPAAESAHERDTAFEWTGGRLELLNPFSERVIWPYSGNIQIPQSVGPPSPEVTVELNVLGSTFCEWIRGGRFKAEYLGDCNWFARCRERLCPGLFGLAIMFNEAHDPTGWHPSAASILEVDGAPVVPFDYAHFQNGVLTRYSEGANPSYFVPWREVLHAAECRWLPKYRVEGWHYLAPNVNQIDGGLETNLTIAEESVRSRIVTPYYEATALDLAVSHLLTGGISFGFVSDARSPLFGQFVIQSGGVYSFGDNTPTSADEWSEWFSARVLQSVPWNLVSDPVEPIPGKTFRFERSDDNSTLPEWLELKLVRV